jgi:hypothetical protein
MSDETVIHCESQAIFFRFGQEARGVFFAIRFALPEQGISSLHGPELKILLTPHRIKLLLRDLFELVKSNEAAAKPKEKGANGKAEHRTPGEESAGKGAIQAGKKSRAKTNGRDQESRE